jgi:hypothetical protein
VEEAARRTAVAKRVEAEEEDLVREKDETAVVVAGLAEAEAAPEVLEAAYRCRQDVSKTE